MSFPKEEEKVDTTCPRCHDRGVVYPSTDEEGNLSATGPIACDLCVAPKASNTISFTDDRANLHSTGYGVPTYSIGYEHDSVDLSPAEARAVAAALLAWADRVAPLPV